MKNQRGTSTLEFIVVLPCLLIVMFGIIEYGWVFLKASQVNNAARQGVRAAVRPDADEQEVEDAVADVMNKAGLSESGYTVEVTGLDSETGDPVEVEVQLTYSNVSLLGAGFVPRPNQLMSSATMAKEGP